jgi:hypothetical protein
MATGKGGAMDHSRGESAKIAPMRVTFRETRIEGIPLTLHHLRSR